jgi:hypothetical protein
MDHLIRSSQTVLARQAGHTSRTNPALQHFRRPLQNLASVSDSGALSDSDLSDSGTPAAERAERLARFSDTQAAERAERLARFSGTQATYAPQVNLIVTPVPNNLFLPVVSTSWIGPIATAPIRRFLGNSAGVSDSSAISDSADASDSEESSRNRIVPSRQVLVQVPLSEAERASSSLLADTCLPEIFEANRECTLMWKWITYFGTPEFVCHTFRNDMNSLGPVLKTEKHVPFAPPGFIAKYIKPQQDRNNSTMARWILVKIVSYS